MFFCHLYHLLFFNIYFTWQRISTGHKGSNKFHTKLLFLLGFVHVVSSPCFSFFFFFWHHRDVNATCKTLLNVGYIMSFCRVCQKMTLHCLKFNCWQLNFNRVWCLMCYAYRWCTWVPSGHVLALKFPTCCVYGAIALTLYLQKGKACLLVNMYLGKMLVIWFCIPQYKLPSECSLSALLVKDKYIVFTLF